MYVCCVVAQIRGWKEWERQITEDHEASNGTYLLDYSHDYQSKHKL